MTRKDAIKTLKELYRETNNPWYEEVYNMAINALEADRKTENCSEFPNNCEDEPQLTLNEAIRHAEQIADSYKDTEPNCKCAEEHRQLAEWLKELRERRAKTEPQTELVRVKYHCINCAENGSYKCSKCDGEMYYKYDKDEPQTERSE